MLDNLDYGRRPFLRIFCVLCLVALTFIGVGCGKHNDEHRAVVAKTRDIVLLVYIDRSDSIRGYSQGGLDGIRADYARISQGFLKPVLQAQDDVLVEARAFVRDDIALFSKRVDRWEQVRGPLAKEFSKNPYRKGLASKTLFSTLLDQIRVRCNTHSKEDYYVLVLTDGHPDEPYAKIEASAKRFAKDNPGNLKCMLIAPVLPDMKLRWREKLEGSLAPLGVATVANNEDFRTACVTTIKEMEDGSR